MEPLSKVKIILTNIISLFITSILIGLLAVAIGIASSFFWAGLSIGVLLWLALNVSAIIFARTLVSVGDRILIYYEENGVTDERYTNLKDAMKKAKKHWWFVN